MEEKYLGKLTKAQREKYLDNVAAFESGSERLFRLKPHALS